jgi:hypothetical protein
MFDDGDSLDVVNQITLNCLISKAQLAKINDKKIKKHAVVERLKQINENKNNLIELYENLLNGIEPDDLCDDVKKSYEHFVDKCIFYFNVKVKNYDNSNDTIDPNDIDTRNVSICEDTSDKIGTMMDLCHSTNYDDIFNSDEEDSENTKCHDVHDEDQFKDDDTMFVFDSDKSSRINIIKR